MRASFRMTVAGCALALAAAAGAFAQDVTITNARILDGKGGVIESGTVVVAGGKIASVAAGAAPAGAKNVIDAGGKTVLPGYIDAHRHIGQPTPENLQGFLDAGFTTVLDALTPVPQATAALAAVRDKINAGEMKGPRLKVSGMVATNKAAMGGRGDAARTDPARIPLADRPKADPMPPEEARAAVRAQAAAGADNIKTILVITPGGGEIETLRAITDEAHKAGIRSVTHTTSVTDALAAVEAGTDVLMHTPHIGWIDENGGVAKIADAHIPMVSTLGVFTPYFDAEHQDVGLFRDNQDFPDDVLHSAGQGPVNLRLLARAGVVVGYGTDTNFPPSDSLRHEIKALVSVLSPADIVKALTGNAAIAADVDDVTGTLEPGKAGDLVLVDGDPLTDIFDVLNVETVWKDGKVVSSEK